jgi:hypothetical protein
MISIVTYRGGVLSRSYAIVAYDLTGHHRLSAQGTDMDVLIRDLRERASQAITSSEPPRKL